MDKLDFRMDNLEHQNDQLIQVVLDTRDRVERLESGFARIEESHVRVFNKMDHFLKILDRHDIEIVALQSAYNRLAGN